MKNTLAPIAIFCFKRFDLLKHLLTSLQKNTLSKKTTAYFFADISKKDIDKDDIKKVKNLIEKCDFFKKKNIIYRKKNFGLKKNILNGIEYVFTKHKNIIVLEDDLTVSKDFLKTMNILLKKYQNNKKISTITGYSFPYHKIKKAKISDNFFLLKRPSSWGWATWHNKWIQLKGGQINYKLDYKEYGNDLSIMKIKNRKKILNSWAYNWTINHINKKKYCIYPKYTMIQNNGFDDQATNNFFKSKKYYSKYKNFNYKNFSFCEENNKIKNLSKSNYDMSVLMYLVKLIFFKFFYGK